MQSDIILQKMRQGYYYTSYLKIILQKHFTLWLTILPNQKIRTDAKYDFQINIQEK